MGAGFVNFQYGSSTCIEEKMDLSDATDSPATLYSNTFTSGEATIVMMTGILAAILLAALAMKDL